MIIDYYKILGVARDATPDEIKSAYRKAALKWHPDRWVSGTDEEQKIAEEKFKAINEAYSVLSNPNERAAYNNELVKKTSRRRSHSQSQHHRSHQSHRRTQHNRKESPRDDTSSYYRASSFDKVVDWAALAIDFLKELFSIPAVKWIVGILIFWGPIHAALPVVFWAVLAIIVAVIIGFIALLFI